MSKQKPGTSGIPRGRGWSRCSPTSLFSDADKGSERALSESADSTEPRGVAATLAGRDVTWRDLGGLRRWARGALREAQQGQMHVERDLATASCIQRGVASGPREATRPFTPLSLREIPPAVPGAPR